MRLCLVLLGITTMVRRARAVLVRQTCTVTTLRHLMAMLRLAPGATTQKVDLSPASSAHLALLAPVVSSQPALALVNGPWLVLLLAQRTLPAQKRTMPLTQPPLKSAHPATTLQVRALVSFVTMAQSVMAPTK